MSTDSTITHDSRISVKLALGACGTVLAVAVAWAHVSVTLQGIRHELRAINARLTDVVRDQGAHVDRREMASWLRELQALNPELRVPALD